MAGPRAARVCAQSCGRGLLAAAAALLLVAGPPGAPARDNDNDNNEQNEQRDTKSRNEQPSLNSISLRTGDGLLEVRAVIVIQARVVEVARTDSLGVDFESLDRVDVSDIPLFGSLFDKPLQAGDLTADNRVGTVYRAGGDSIAALLDDGIDLSGVQLSVVNGKGRFEVTQRPSLIDIVPTELGALGALPSVQTVIAGSAPEGTTLVLGGLTRDTLPETKNNVPVLGDIPVLQRLFLGTVHQREDKQLILFIRPSIIAGDEEDY